MNAQWQGQKITVYVCLSEFVSFTAHVWDQGVSLYTNLLYILYKLKIIYNIIKKKQHGYSTDKLIL